MTNITLGQFFPGDSPVHRLDPRTKLLFTVAMIANVFLASTAWGYLILAAFIVGATVLSRISLKFLAKGLKPILFIVIFTFVLNVLFATSGNVLFAWGIISVTDRGIVTSIFMAARLILLVCGTQLLTLTTSPIALTDGMEMLMAPLARIGFPAHDLAMMMSIALRFIPTLLEEADKIMKAQTARGADFSSGNLIARAKAMVPLLVPLFVGAFRRADELALAMEARCYRGGEKRTRMKELRFTALDLYPAIAMTLLTAACVVL
ncbi:MAG: energy-coupling factor transporter transmembrane component T family protein [Christensenellales bacterium]|jgi:energy-coupling factor transport system permease protein